MSSPRVRTAALAGGSSSAAPSPTTPTPIPDDPDADASLPMTMSASMVLSSLPTDARTALSNVEGMEGVKVKIRFHVIGDAPALAQQTFKISASNRFEAVVSFLRRRLGLRPEQSVLCYVNRVFSPGLDESVGGLWKCFKGGDEQLNIWYSMTPAFG